MVFLKKYPRVKDNKMKKNDKINTLSDNDLQSIAKLVFIDNLSDEEIASISKMSKPTLYKLKRTECFQNHLKDYGALAVREADSRIQAHANKAVDTLISLLNNENSNIKLKASTEILRLAGLGQPLPNFTHDNNKSSDKSLLLQYLSVIATNKSKAIAE